MRFISRIILKITGWKLEGSIPPEVRKCVLIGVPHTSNWDFFYGRAALYVWGIKLRYLIKKEYFRFPYGWLFKLTGGIPVDRSQHTDMVDAMVSLFDDFDELTVLFAPEGTRSRVRKWKTGFYHVAVKAQIPIALGRIDYKNKKSSIGPMFEPSGDMVKDFEYLEEFYKDSTGKNPENFNSTIFEREEFAQKYGTTAG